jgi:hypothetical protein
MNSLFLGNKFCALEIAMALLTMANGIALASPILKLTFPKNIKADARLALKINMGISAIKEDFPIYLNFDLLNSNSKEPSRTIKIKPMAPKKGRIGDKSGTIMEKIMEACLTTHPKKRSKITDGILVFDDVISNTYAKSSKILIVIIIGIVMSMYEFS